MPKVKEIIPQGQLVPFWLFMRDTRTIPIAQKLKSISKSNDDYIIKTYDFIKANVQYVLDKKSFGMEEYVQMPDETLRNGKADCEDMSILFVNLMLHAGIPARMALGYGGSSSHRWPEVIYGGQWYVFDPTVDKSQGIFPISEYKSYHYDPLYYVYPFAIELTKLPIPPIPVP